MSHTIVGGGFVRGVMLGALICAVPVAIADGNGINDLSAFWVNKNNTNEIAALPKDALIGTWKARCYYVRRDTSAAGKVAVAKNESIQQICMNQDGAMDGLVKIKNNQMPNRKYSGNWSYTNGVLTLPSNVPAQTNSVAYHVIWRSPDEIELRFARVEYTEQRLVHHGRYDESGNLAVHCTITSASGDSSTIELLQSPSVFKRQK